MKPGKFVGQLSTDWVNKDWMQIHQCPAHPDRFAYVAADGSRFEPEGKAWTNGGSVPRVFQNIIRRDELLPAFVIHDWLYDRGQHIVTRKEADYYLAEMIYTLTCGYYWLRRWIIWASVRIFGRWAWRLPANEEQAKVLPE